MDKVKENKYSTMEKENLIENLRKLRLEGIEIEQTLEEKISKGFKDADEEGINWMEVGHQGFQDLMSHRVKDILLISSMYDSFIVEQETNLSEQILNEYLELNLTYVPHLKQAPNCQEGIRMLLEQRFDLVVIMTKLSKEDATYFAKSVKELRPFTPVVVLLQSESEYLRVYKDIPKDIIDKSFLWTGNSNILLGVIKFIEDRMNVDYDVKVGNVRVILGVEDSIKYYSLYLPIIHKEVMKQTRSLIDTSLNNLERQLRMRVRPKILLVETYEEILELYEKYKTNVIGIISDVEYNKDGKIDTRAGFKLTEKVKEEFFDIPILLQSSEKFHEKEAHKLGASFMHKSSHFVGDELSSFIVKHLGFGPFVFKLPDDTIIGIAHDLREICDKLAEIPDDSLMYHAESNHFSNWFAARGEFTLAEKLRIKKISDFKGIEHIRTYLIDAIKDYQRVKKEGIITDFDYWAEEETTEKTDFVRIGSGFIGGKARGIAFVRYLLLKSRVRELFKNLNINIPLTVVLATDIFDEFLEKNKLHQLSYNGKNDYTIRDTYLLGAFPKDVEDKLKKILEKIKTPIAVRSSSLLEDSQYQPFAGVYDTYIIPNNPNKTMDSRLNDLKSAVKLVYASTYLQDAKNYMLSTSSRIQEEKMAVIIQEAVGKNYGRFFYPNISGVAQSYNFYPFRHIKPENGLATIALGFGRAVVEGETSFRYSPPYPHILPQFSTVKDILQNSQKYFYALDIKDDVSEKLLYGDELFDRLEVSEAENHGSLKFIASTYMPQNDRIYDGIFQDGYRIITFSRVLKSDAFPLNSVLEKILDISSKAMGTAIEIEFALNLGDENTPSEFNLLQIRPMVVGREFKFDFDSVDKNDIIVSSTKAFGNGKVDNIKDIIYVRKDNFDPAHTQDIARELGNLNLKMQESNTPYILIGPGRWGSSDPWLGIPVKWSQISKAQIIIETNLKDFLVDPSLGSHFFQNITSLGVFYLTIDINKEKDFIKWESLDKFPAVYESKYIRHIKTSEKIEAFIDGKKSRGIITKL